MSEIWSFVAACGGRMLYVPPEPLPSAYQRSAPDFVAVQNAITGATAPGAAGSVFQAVPDADPSAHGPAAATFTPLTWGRSRMEATVEG